MLLSWKNNKNTFDYLYNYVYHHIESLDELLFLFLCLCFFFTYYYPESSFISPYSSPPSCDCLFNYGIVNFLKDDPTSSSSSDIFFDFLFLFSYELDYGVFDLFLCCSCSLFSRKAR